jgi:hypothetical protein
MKMTFMRVWLALLFMSGVVFVNCSDDDQRMMPNTENAVVSIAAILPADGSTGVATSTSIALRFTGPVDTSSVMNNLHLAGGQAMHKWRDSVSHHGGFGMMNMGMRDSMIMWMDSIHTSGEYHWNAARDSCEFVPDSALTPGTEYLCLLYEGGMHDSHGGMMGGANHNDDGYHMYGFSTGP